MSLDPRSAAWLSMLHRIDAPRLHELPVDVARRSYFKLMFAYGGDAEPVAEVADLFMPRREYEGGALAARLYRPRDAVWETRLPVILWLHGGGWVLGDFPCYDNWCRALANTCGAAVVALDYRLAPEQRFPAAVDDAWFALRWLAREAERLQLDAQEMSVAGDSAGATLAAVLCLLSRDLKGPALQRQVLIYPAVDLKGPYASADLYGNEHFLERESLDWFVHNYLASDFDKMDWRASPLRADNHANLPPALVINAECDPLADQGDAYVRKLKQAGVPAQRILYEGMVHGFVTMFKLFDEAYAVLGEISRFLKKE
jgi:acetyl esterase